MNGFTIAVHGLAVGLHVQLLQVGREPAQRLGIRQHGGGGIAQNITLVNADQGIQHGGILRQLLILCQLVCLGSAIQELSEHLRAKGQGQHSTAHAGGRGKPAADIVIHEEGSQIVSALGQRRSFAGHCDHVLGGIQTGLGQSILHKGLVGQGFQGGSGLGNQNKQGVGQVQIAQHTGSIIGINIGNEGCLHL